MMWMIIATALAAPPATCDWAGDWQLTFAELKTDDPPFSTSASWNQESWGWCVTHPGSPVNARLDVTPTADTLRVQWMSQPIVDSFTRVQTGPLVPVRGKAPVEPPPTCAKALNPVSFSDRPIAFLRDAWGYTCTIETSNCDQLHCQLFQGPEEFDVGTFEMIRLDSTQ